MIKDEKVEMIMCPLNKHNQHPILLNIAEGIQVHSTLHLHRKSYRVKHTVKLFRHCSPRSDHIYSAFVCQESRSQV